MGGGAFQLQVASFELRGTVVMGGGVAGGYGLIQEPVAFLPGRALITNPRR